MSVEEITSEAELQALISSTPFVALQAYATYSGPCKFMGPIFTRHAHELTIPGKSVFATFDVDAVPDLSDELGVNTMPTFIFYENGEKIDLFTGAKPQLLKDVVEKLSSKAQA